MSVHCDRPDWVKRAKRILEDTGAEDIASAGEATADFAKSDKPMPRRATKPVVTRADAERLEARLKPNPKANAGENLDDTVEELDRRDSLTKHT